MQDLRDVREYADSHDELGDVLDAPVVLLKNVDVLNAVQIALKVASKAPLPICIFATALDITIEPIKKSTPKSEEKAEKVAYKVGKKVSVAGQIFQA